MQQFYHLQFVLPALVVNIYLVRMDIAYGNDILKVDSLDSGLLLKEFLYLLFSVLDQVLVLKKAKSMYMDV